MNVVVKHEGFKFFIVEFNFLRAKSFASGVREGDFFDFSTGASNGTLRE